MFPLTAREMARLKKLTTPIKIQNFLDRFPRNYEKNGETYMSPRRTLRAGKMHCFEGALIAALALWIQGERPLLLDLRADGDDDHVVALYRKNGFWGAISKTSYASLRFRDPIYRTLRELALSYFHEYFDNTTGKKCLREYSAKPFDLRKFGKKWITDEIDLQYIVDAINETTHCDIIPRKNRRLIRPADAMERKAGRLMEWTKKDPET